MFSNLTKLSLVLKQAPEAWYKRLSNFLLENNFKIGSVDTTMFPRDHFSLVQVYIDNIIFEVTDETLCKEFSKLMQTKFETSMIGDLKFSLGLQKKTT